MSASVRQPVELTTAPRRPNPFNPVVVEHRDEHMNHTNDHDPTTTNYYITVGTIWQWFFAHPRLP